MPPISMRKTSKISTPTERIAALMWQTRPPRWVMTSRLPWSPSKCRQGNRATQRRLVHTRFRVCITGNFSVSLRPHFRILFHAIFTSRCFRSYTGHQLLAQSNVYMVNCIIQMRSSRSITVSRIARRRHLMIQGASSRRLSLRSCFGQTQRISQTSEPQNSGQYTCFLETFQSTSDHDHPPVPAITLLTFPQCVLTIAVICAFTNISIASGLIRELDCRLAPTLGNTAQPTHGSLPA